MTEVVHVAAEFDHGLLRDWVSTAAWVSAGNADYLLGQHAALTRARPPGAALTLPGARRLLSVLAAYTSVQFSQNDTNRRMVRLGCAKSMEEFAATVLGCFDPYGRACYTVLTEATPSSWPSCLARIAPIALWQPDNPKVYATAKEAVNEGARIIGTLHDTFDIAYYLDNQYLGVFLPALGRTSWGAASQPSR